MWEETDAWKNDKIPTAEEFVGINGDKVFTEDWAKEAVCLMWVNRQTNKVSERWIQLSAPIIDKDRFDEFFVNALEGYLSIQHQELHEGVEDLLK